MSAAAQVSVVSRCSESVEGLSLLIMRPHADIQLTLRQGYRLLRDVYI
jgi:hypothetical protein